MAYTEIDTDSLFARMFGAAREEARSSWNDIRGILKVELKGTARQIKELGKGVALGDLPQEQARLVVRLTRSQIATVLASATALTIWQLVLRSMPSARKSTAPSASTCSDHPPAAPARNRGLARLLAARFCQAGQVSKPLIANQSKIGIRLAHRLHCGYVPIYRMESGDPYGIRTRVPTVKG